MLIIQKYESNRRTRERERYTGKKRNQTLPTMFIERFLEFVTVDKPSTRPAIYATQPRVEWDQRNSTELTAKGRSWVEGVCNHWKPALHRRWRLTSVSLRQEQRRLSSCKRNRWRAFTVTTGGWVLMFSKLFRVHRTRYKQKCIKVHSDPWLIDRLIN